MQGNEIRSDVTIEDPILAELLPERGDCGTYEPGDVTSHIRH